jgi:hypothetical protein
MRLLSTTCRVDRRRYTPPINTQTLPHAICGCHDACSDHEFGAHEDQRACPADDPALGFDKLADLNSIDEMHVELDGRLRLAFVSPAQRHHLDDNLLRRPEPGD